MSQKLTHFYVYLYEYELRTYSISWLVVYAERVLSTTKSLKCQNEDQYGWNCQAFSIPATPPKLVTITEHSYSHGFQYSY